MTFILYNREDCPFCWKVRLVAEFVGVEFDFINVERGEQNEDVISLNPGGTVPVMITESFVLWDSSLIAIYLADAHKEAGLLPDDVAHRVQILQTCLYSDVYFGKAIFPYVKEMRKPNPEDRDIQILSQSRERFEYALGWLSTFFSQMGGSEKPNLMDCTFFPRFALADKYGLRFDHAQDYARWYGAFKELDQVKAAYY